MGSHLKLNLGLFIIINCAWMTTSRQLQEVEVLQKSTCETVYKNTLGNRTNIDFSKPVGNLWCDPGPDGFIRFHCMENEQGLQLKFCTDWIWVEAGLCPKLYSLQSIINPVECNKTKGCPKNRYQSHEYYKYPACFNITKVNNESTEQPDRNLASPDQKNGNQIAFTIGMIILGIFVPLILIAVVVYLLWKRRKQNQTVERVRPLAEAKYHLDAGNCILITGKKGEGVSTFIPSLHETHYSSYKKRKVEYSFDRIHASNQLFLMINSDKLEENEFDGLFKLIKRPDRQTKIIIDVTRSRYDELKRRFDRACPHRVAGMDLSSDDLKMTSQERKELITIFFKKSRIRESALSDKQRSQITILIEFESSEYGFSHVCDRFFEASKGEVINRLNDVKSALKKCKVRPTEKNTCEPQDELGIDLPLLTEVN